MNKIIGLGCIAFLLASCGGGEKKAEKQQVPEEVKPLVSKNSGAFNQSFGKLLDTYESLKNALVEYDTAAANTAAAALAISVKEVSVSDIQGDSTGAIRETAASYTAAIESSANEFISSADITKKKRQFQSISDAMYDLARTVRYDQEKIYRQHCPMAFNDDEEAFWLSSSNEVVNPYLGKKHPKYKGGMLHCGDVTDSLDYH